MYNFFPLSAAIFPCSTLFPCPAESSVTFTPLTCGRGSALLTLVISPLSLFTINTYPLYSTSNVVPSAFAFTLVAPLSFK